MTKNWFREKSIGIGWYPASWEGWTISLVFSALLLSTVNFFYAITKSFSDFIKFFLPSTIILFFLFFWIAKNTVEKTAVS